jgi:hypothetical protein
MQIRRKFHQLQEQQKRNQLANDESPTKLSQSPGVKREANEPMTDLYIDRRKLDKLYRQILQESRPDELIDVRAGEQLSMKDQESAHRVLMQRIDSGVYNSLLLAGLASKPEDQRTHPVFQISFRPRGCCSLHQAVEGKGSQVLFIKSITRPSVDLRNHESEPISIK